MVYSFVEFISVSRDERYKLINPREEEWKVYPRRGSAPPETENFPLTIFGGGGYRVGFLETDKDSTLHYEDGLRANLYDDGKDIRFRKAFVAIHDTAIRKGGWMRFRIRVNAEDNGQSELPKDDNDDFYIDNFRLMFPCGCTDISMHSVNIKNPNTEIPLDLSMRIPINATIANNTPVVSPTFWIKVKVKHEDAPYWPYFDECYEHIDSNNDGYCDNCGAPMDLKVSEGYQRTAIITYLTGMTEVKVDLPSISMSTFSKYIHPRSE